MATQSVVIPGLRDLMFDNLSHPDPALAEKAASNVFDAVNFGIEAIGDLLFSASMNKDYPPDLDTIAHVGCLIKQLAELSTRCEGLSGLVQFRKDLDQVLKEERAAHLKAGPEAVA